MNKGKRKKISLIYTGGTIGVNENKSGNLLKSEGTGQFLLDMIFNECPRLNKDYDLSFKRMGSLLSENIVPDDWIHISNSIAAEVNSGADGIVIAHGTDSLAYSSSAVSFMLQGVPIPIVFTGSMHPPDREGTDAIQNLLDSIQFSAESNLSGVYVVFKSNDESRDIFLGSRIESIPPYENQFKSVDKNLVGKIADGAITIFSKNYPQRRELKDKFYPQCKIDPAVAFFTVFPGFDPRWLKKAHYRGAKGIILNLYHSGTACTRNGSNYSLLPVINELSKKIVIFGNPFPSLTSDSIYISTSNLHNAGLAPLKRMSNEASITKLMWLLGKSESKFFLEGTKQINERIIGQMNMNEANEIVE